MSKVLTIYCQAPWPVILSSPEVNVGRITVQGRWQKASKTQSQSISQSWWHTLMIPAIWEVTGRRITA
jgi:hypothetical protein